MTRTEGASAAMACIAPMIAAAPPMSDFMVSMDFGGFSESPPESNVMPLPTNTTVVVRLWRRVLQPHQPRRVHGALAHARRSRRSRCARAPSRPGPRPAGRPRRPPAPPPPPGLGVQVRGSGVDQVTGERHRGGEGLGPEPDAVRVIRGGEHGDRGRGPAILPVPGERVAAQQRADRDGLGGRRVGRGQRERDPQAAPFRWLRHGRGRPASRRPRRPRGGASPGRRSRCRPGPGRPRRSPVR